MINDKIKFKFNIENLERYKSVLADLARINSTVKIKITDEDKIILYSVDTAGGNTAMSNAPTLAFKTYVFPTDFFFKMEGYEDEEIKDNIDWIIKNVNILNKKLMFFDNKEADIRGVFSVRTTNQSDSKQTRSVIMTDSKFKFTITGDEPHVVRDIGLNTISNLLDPSLSEMSFSVSSSEFLNARRASVIENVDDTIDIILRNKRIYFTQSKWELLVGKTEFEGEKKISFNKKYLKSINPEVETINFSLFPTFILYQEGNQKLMISFEQSFS